MSGELIDTTEMYLRTILELEEENIPPMRARIVERLGQSGPTVSQTVARMERDGLVFVGEGRRLELTPEGRTLATRVTRKHRLAERLLVDILGLDLELVHDEACRWEHVMSDHVERRIVALLTSPTESPFGNPIPGLGELSDAKGDSQAVGEASQNVQDFMLGRSGAKEAVVVRLTESLQADAEAMASVAIAGVRPGRTVTIELSDQMFRIYGQNVHPVTITTFIASHLFVREIPRN